MEVTDKDYGEMTVKVVKHELWPVSYLYKGRQYDVIYTYKPLANECVVGEAFTVETMHPTTIPVSAARKARIAELKAELEKLESGHE